MASPNAAWLPVMGRITPILTVFWQAPGSQNPATSARQAEILLRRITPPSRSANRRLSRRIIHSDGSESGQSFDLQQWLSFQRFAHSGAGIMGLASAMLGG